MKKFYHSVVQKQRIPLVMAIFILLTFSVFARLFYLQVLHYGDYKKVAAAQHSFKDTIQAKRGQIFAYDTLSNTPYVIANNQTLNLVYLNPKEIDENKEETVTRLVEILGMKKEDVEAKIDPKQVYVILMHKLTNDQSDKITAANLKGVYLQPENWRFYPEQTFASSVLGFVNNEGDGNYGIGQYFNDVLKGQDGYLNEETDAHGVRIAFGKKSGSTPAVNGSDIYLTIDKYIQAKAEQLLADGIKKYSADSGSIIVMDKTSGKIMAMANAPTFDPNNYTQVTDYSVFKNRAVTDIYEPGSVFKAVTLAAGVDSGQVTPDTTYTDTGFVVVDGVKISNSTPKVHGVCNMTYVLQESLNTGTTFVQQKMGKQPFYDYVKKFGFGELTGIEFDGESQGTVYPPNKVSDLGYATMSFGQGISSTALQMLSGFATIANNGKMVKPYIVDKVVDPNGKAKVTKTTEIRQVISEKTSQELQAMLQVVVEKGHGFQAKIPGYKIAGKTGTAQVVKPDGTGYEANKNIGTFIGFPIADNANFVVLAKIDNPKGVPWAEESAAPLVGSMLDYLLKYYQIPPTEKVQ